MTMKNGLYTEKELMAEAERTGYKHTDANSHCVSSSGYPRIKLMTVTEMEESGEYSEELIEYLKSTDIESVEYGSPLRCGIKLEHVEDNNETNHE